MEGTERTIAIYNATPEDSIDIWKLQRVAFLKEAKLYGDYDITPLAERAEDIEDSFQEYRYLKAVTEGAIVGSVRRSLAPLDGGGEEGEVPTWEVGRLIVYPEFQRKGIGSRLMETLEAELLKERGGEACRFELCTGERSEDNIRFYESIGYRTFKRVEPEEGGKVSFIYMEKGP